jgi:ring-1,2-phenylacetyl-CoA epoxidase subunit PaaD
MNIAIDDIMGWLQEVKDPEIPVLSLVDMGIIRNIEIDGDKVEVTITPTFVGCPALDFIRDEILSALHDHGIAEATVIVSFKEPWSSDMITENGKRALKEFGLAPPMKVALIDDIGFLDEVACPRCSGTNTELKTPFGPTLCRSIHYCHDCREAFEQFKPV